MNSATSPIAADAEEPLDEVAALKAVVARQQRDIQRLQEKLHYLLHRQFGRRAEQLSPDQRELFEPPATEVTDDTAQADTEEITYTRKKGGRARPPKHLPRVRVEHDLPEADKHCTCGACLERIGEEVSEQYDVIPPVFQVLEHVRFKYACPDCEATGVKTAAKTTPDPLPRHQVSPGLLAWLGTSKYVDGLPLHRVAQMLDQRFGVALTSTTLAQWMINTHDALLAPLLHVVEGYFTRVDYLHADETTLQVLDEPDRYAWQKSYLWVRMTGTGPPIIRVDYDPSRAGAVAERLLSGFKGYLQTDAYAAYNGAVAQPEVMAVGCLAHARRRFDAVLKAIGQHSPRPEACLAREALGFIRRLYGIEKAIKGKSADERLARRQSDSQAVLDDFEAWWRQHLDHAASTGGTLAKAFTYLSNQWDKLTVFVQDERLQLDNNRAERHIRPIAQGRHAWLFARSQKGAHASAAWNSIVETAKANGLEPYHYLKSLFTELPSYLQQGRELDPLLPWNVTPEQIKTPATARG